MRPLLLALAVFAVGALPELGRMIEFHNFETFDPNGPGLGNLFGQVSPLTALGIWFSGDFRVAAGDGAVPAVVYYLGAAFAAGLLVLGLAALPARSRERDSRRRRRRRAPLCGGEDRRHPVHLGEGARAGGAGHRPRDRRPLARRGLHALRARASSGLPIWAYLAAAGFCSLLALANAPVGPSSYSPALTGLRPLIASGSTLVLAPRQLLDEEHGERYLDWELRGGRVCIADEDDPPAELPAGVALVITSDESTRPPFPGMAWRGGRPVPALGPPSGVTGPATAR